MKKKLLTYFLLLTLSMPMLAQSSNTGMAYLEEVFPKLTNLYRKELQSRNAHYIFAIDVSGTMDKYQEMVANSLVPFFQALPNGDYVDIIPFGTKALPSLANYCGVISPQVKTALCNNIRNLYSDPTYPEGFKGYTDVQKAIESVANIVQSNKNYQINIIIILTDFRNDVKGDSPSEHKFSENQLEQMSTQISAATNGLYTRTIALELPVDKTKPGYCLDQLGNNVFCAREEIPYGLEIVSMSNPGEMIRSWFDKLKREIMVTKLKGIIDLENRTGSTELVSEIDYDGNVLAKKIKWSPSKLYTTIQIDSTYVTNDEFEFVNNKENFVTTQDTVLTEIELGQIKHENWFFHHLQDTINLGVLLPTPYDEELESLGVKKPLPNTTQPVDKWIFTFFLPLWVCVAIIILLIIYILWVLKAITRNAAYKMNAEVSIYDDNSDRIGPTKRPSGISSLIVGKGGSNSCNVSMCDWQFVISKVNSNPFIPWKKPYFEWHQSQGVVYKGTHKSGSSGILDKSNNSILKVKCCDKSGVLQHSVKVRIKPD